MLVFDGSQDRARGDLSDVLVLRTSGAARIGTFAIVGGYRERSTLGGDDGCIAEQSRDCRAVQRC